MLMEQSTNNTKMGTPTKCRQAVQPKVSENLKSSENFNPNVTSPCPTQKPSSSPQLLRSSGKLQKSVPRNPNPVFVSPRNRIRERKFVVAKKKKNINNDGVKNAAGNPNCKCRDRIDGKCLCVAYETLRASQEKFLKSWKGEEVIVIGVEDCENESKPFSGIPEEGKGYSKDESESDILLANESVNCEPEETESPNGTVGSSSIKRRRDKLMEEARQSVPDPGSGRVLHLVQAFEKLLTIPKKSEKKDGKEEEEEDVKKGIKWALPGLQRPKAPETFESSSSFCPEDLVLTAENLGLGSRVSSSSVSSQGSSRRGSTESVRSRRNSSVSSRNVGGRKLTKKQLTVTSQKPFKLRTEERGKEKEEEFIKKLQEMIIQEEKQRIPIAQGLPWTTDEPEILIKPSVKESTRPMDVKLHTDVRAVDRAEFDYQMSEKMSLIEQYRMERERQQKLAEEEEVKSLRKELVPKAQPMPYFDRPFIPRRSMKQPTIPREPKFHVPHHKKIKSCLSWNDFNHLYAHQH